MARPRWSIAWVMALVAVSAVDLAVIHALVDGPEALFLFDALPMANLLALAGFVGFRSRRRRAFAAGFVVAGASSLIAYKVWAENHPWTWLGDVEPLTTLVARAEDSHSLYAIIPAYAVLVLALAVPHTLLGLAGGCLAARGWAIFQRRKASW
jgi:hypothetical protein